MSLDRALMLLPVGWRYHVGHTPHWYRRDELPKFLKKRPFEAYVCNGEKLGTKAFILESADGATAAEALASAIKLGLQKASSKALPDDRLVQPQSLGCGKTLTRPQSDDANRGMAPHQPSRGE